MIFYNNIQLLMTDSSWIVALFIFVLTKGLDTELDHKSKFGNVSPKNYVDPSLMYNISSTTSENVATMFSQANVTKTFVQPRAKRDITGYYVYDETDEDTITVTFYFHFPGARFTALTDLTQSTTVKVTQEITDTSVTHRTVANGVVIPPWILCILLKPPPKFCKMLDEIHGLPISPKPSTTCVTLVHSYPGIPPFHFPDPPPNCCPELAAQIGGHQIDKKDSKKEMLLHMLCTVLKPAPTWCPDMFKEKSDSTYTTDECDGVTDVALPDWVLCFMFKPTPPFCKQYEEYDGTRMVTTTCATVMFSGIPPFPPVWPHPPIIWPPCGGYTPVKDDESFPWWLLCSFIKPVPDWCPDIFRCYTASDTPDTSEYPWWKLCQIMNPRPKECDFITPPLKITTVNPKDPNWWVCLVMKPVPKWCKYITYPPTLIPTPTTVDYTIEPLTITIDREYPLWYMCIVVKPPPDWCVNAEFPSHIQDPDYPKHIEDGIEDVGIFMHCWWWLCELLKPWATWCENFPPPPKGLLESFKKKLPSDILAGLPVPPLVLELP